MKRPRDHVRLIAGGSQPAELNARDALAIVRDIARDSADIAVVEPHASKRMRQRRISFQDIQRVLLRGWITEGPYIANHSGWWRLNVTGRVSGEERTCVVEIEWAKRLLVVTVF